LYAASGYDSPPMPPQTGSLRIRSAALGATALAILAVSGCGTLVTVSSRITPLPPTCSRVRPDADLDSFAVKASLQPGPSGLQFGDLSVGCGPAAKASSNVNVQFTVWLQDGTQVITTRGQGQPANALQLGNSQTLKFWRVGVPGMHVGGTRQLVVPPALAFGAAGYPSANVPPNATLIVDVELESIAGG
jgi:FKBP-type peptidyl-prolyl cis-trans isomerase FkpA